MMDAFVTKNRDRCTAERAMEKIWAKREKRIERVVKNASRLHGSLQCVAASTLPELKVLELKALKGE